MKDVAIIALEYLEPEYQQTINCLMNVDWPVFMAYRDGVGNMSRAFNQVVKDLINGFDKKFKYYWFVTNVQFNSYVPEQLYEFLEANPDFAAVHPCVAGSDHPFLRPKKFQGITAEEIGFFELMAPMIRADKFYPFCEQTPYWYMDLILSHQLRAQGYKIAVHHQAEIKHIYLRHHKKHFISQIREKLRQYYAQPSKEYMNKTYGPNWEKELRFQFY